MGGRFGEMSTCMNYTLQSFKHVAAQPGRVCIDVYDEGVTVVSAWL